MKELIDLHIHTTSSDGVLTPYEVIDEAKKNNVKTISITDHDTVSAYTKELIEYAKEKEIKLIPGIEISTKTKRCGIHILGYDIDIHNKEFLEKLEKIRNARHDYLYNVSKKLKELGYIVNIEELDKIESVTKAHIALDIINNKENNKQLLKEFNDIPSKGQFIETLLNEGCPAYVKKESITPKEASELIRKVNGKVVLAHPVAYYYEDNLTEEDIQELIEEISPDGIEAYYIYIDKKGVKHNDIEKWVEFSKRNKKEMTIGSDFHSFDNIHPVIGLLKEDIDKEGKYYERIKRFI